MKGRTLFLAGIVLGTIVLGILFVLLGVEATWKLWDIPTMVPFFADVGVITSGTESYARGYDPLVENPMDQRGRPMNYPRIWQLLCVAGVDTRFTVAIGLSFALLFLTGLILAMPASIDRTTAGLMLGMVFSPAILLGLERGNTDLFIYFLLSLAVCLFARGSTVARVCALGAMLLAFMLKLYPVAGFVAAVRDRRRVVATGIAVLLTGVAYLAYNRSDLPLIYQATEKSMFLSYGANVIPMYMTKHHGDAAGQASRMVSHGAVLLGGVFISYGLRLPGAARSGSPKTDLKGLDAFRVGSAVYLVTFAIGNNWDYRLMFLLLTLPHLGWLARWHFRPMSRIAGAVLFAFLVSAWYLKIGRVMDFNAASFFLDEVCNWTIFYGLALLLGYSAPDWIKARWQGDRAAVPPEGERISFEGGG